MGISNKTITRLAAVLTSPVKEIIASNAGSTRVSSSTGQALIWAFSTLISGIVVEVVRRAS